MHTSVKLDFPVEFINITPFNPLISKCQIKVCYVSDKPNRNRSVITKEVARKMANSLPGSPIVGYYNETAGDFEEHNQEIVISNGQVKMRSTTRPYGFVDLGAKVWFQKFMDDGAIEREYLMTEGWLWTGQYPECARIIEQGNNHSMELDKDFLNATWTKDKNGKPQFFIINEAIISKLCTLGEKYEPCFEGANITSPTIQFAFEDGFKEQVFSMMNELKELLTKGGEKVFTRYAVEIGDALWTALYSHVEGNYEIESVCEDGEQKFAMLVADDKYYRLNFTLGEDNSVEFNTLYELVEDYTPFEEAQFDPVAVAEYAAKVKKSDDDDDNEDKEEKCPKCGKKKSECTCNDEDDDEEEKNKKGKKSKYNLEEIQEYVELSEKYSALEISNNENLATIESLQAQVEELTAFKAKIEKAEKEKMIDSFYMLSDEDKKDVVTNIDTYSLDDIEAKLSIICVRNKVNFNLEDDNKPNNDPTIFSLSNPDDNVPAWVQSLRQVAKSM